MYFRIFVQGLDFSHTLSIVLFMDQQQFYRSNNFEVHGIYDPRDTEKVIVFEVVDLIQRRVAYMVGDLGIAFINSTRRVITEKST